ncbi:putative glycosyltransferase [Methanocella paludicola SANAE]|uniref:Glycosyltransferase n=1 Tax=Methanocella paludicola (strain DSM 17711 / JCM 13418 / NBRC 101707 / SANAE) TaxID=304371 RepID=D1YZY0_METPS|nr:glycosyltransferase family 2 protein [Methanocella paludicola]BAI62002.1 putative glycosyltransferase [Methanocella paludicola SANAE]
MDFPKVIILILNWNGKSDTIDCIESLKAVDYPNYYILLIDNGSTDGSVELFKNKYPGIEIIQNKKNLGFAEGNNSGIRYVYDNNYEYLLLLNNDTTVSTDFLNKLVIAAENYKNVGFAGPMIYFYDYHGRKDIISFVGGKLSKWRGTVRHLGAKEVDNGQYNRTIEVDYVEGSCILVKRDVIEKIGLLDPQYFLYWEDTDWCERGRKIGYKTISVPDAKIWHKISATSNRRGGTNSYYMTRNCFIFMRKNASTSQFISFLTYFILFKFWYNILMYGIYYRNIAELKGFLKGTFDYFIKT